MPRKPKRGSVATASYPLVRVSLIVERKYWTLESVIVFLQNVDGPICILQRGDIRVAGEMTQAISWDFDATKFKSGVDACDELLSDWMNPRHVIVGIEDVRRRGFICDTGSDQFRAMYDTAPYRLTRQLDVAVQALVSAG